VSECEPGRAEVSSVECERCVKCETTGDGDVGEELCVCGCVRGDAARRVCACVCCVCVLSVCVCVCGLRFVRCGGGVGGVVVVMEWYEESA